MIENTNSKVTYIADGLTTSWAIPFTFINQDDIEIYVAEGEGVTKITENYAFNEQNTAITYPTSGSGLPNVKAGNKVIIMRATPQTQEEDSSQVHYTSQDIERALDKLTMIAQELQEQLSRTVTMDVADDGEEDTSVSDLVEQMKELYAQILDLATEASEDAQEAIQAAIDAYNQVEKLYSHTERYVAGTAQNNYTGSLTDFKFVSKYKADTETLKVFVNGSLKRPGATEDYVEVVDPSLAEDGDNYGDSITFNSALTSGDEVDVMWGSVLTMPGGEVAQQAATAAQNAQASAEAAAESAEEAESYLNKFVPQMIGDVVWSQSATGGDNPGRIPGWTGETVLTSAWPALATFLSNHPELCKTQSEVNTLISKYGECPYYVYDFSAGTIKMPVYKRKMVGVLEPDWENKVDLDVNNDVRNKHWTAPSDGLFFYTDFVYGGNHPTELHINGEYFGWLNRSNSSDHNNGSQNAIMFPVKAGDDVYITVQYGPESCWASFTPYKTSSANTSYNYPWIVGANSVDGLVQHNGGFISVRFYTREQYENLGSVPQNELCLIEEEIIE